jgi:DNA-binding NarL/FixJ family response regulator
MRKAKVLIADDHSLMAEGLASILASEFEIVGVVSDGRQILAETSRVMPDLVCLDIGMPGLNGIQAALELHRTHPKLKIIFVTQQIGLPYLRAAFRAGGVGYVAKQSAGSELMTAMRTVMNGGTFITPLLADKISHDPKELAFNPGGAFTDALTPRQREVLQSIAEGRTTKEISTLLKISPKTVEFHRSCVMDELGLRTTAELTRYALSHHLIAHEPTPSAVLGIE